ncbi:MAG: rod shape-determining protein MreC, partial [Verrucomicrobiota bacterium]
MKRDNIIAFIVFIILLLWVFSLSPDRVESFQSRFLSIFSPVIETAAKLGRLSAVEDRMSKRELKARLVEMKVELTKLRIQETQFNQVASENIRLQKALDFKERSSYDLLSAKVVARDSATWWESIVIDRGSADGLDKDMAVITDEGLIGKTRNVLEDRSRVLLLTNERCRVTARVQGTHFLGITEGFRIPSKADPKVRLRFLDKGAQI